MRMNDLEQDAPPRDGRQSEIAEQLARGVRRLLRDLDVASVCELRLPNNRRADVVGLDRHGRVTIIEIKSCLADFRADQKWQEYLPFCDRFYFAIAQGPLTEVMPQQSGLMIADAYGAFVARESPVIEAAPARRRAVLLNFARQAAKDLHALRDPHALGNA